MNVPKTVISELVEQFKLYILGMLSVLQYLSDGVVQGELQSLWVWSGVGVAKSGVSVTAPGIDISSGDTCKWRDM